jgi:hypothetical protein
MLIPKRSVMHSVPKVMCKYRTRISFTLHDSLAPRFEQCGCADSNKWNARSIVLPGTNRTINAPLCFMNNSCFPQAIITFSTSQSIMDKYCSDCQMQCSITGFDVQTSSSAAPIEYQMNDTKIFAENSTVPLPANWSSTWREEIYRNYLRSILVNRQVYGLVLVFFH